LSGILGRRRWTDRLCKGRIAGLAILAVIIIAGPAGRAIGQQ